jgi:hypothetical protein
MSTEPVSGILIGTWTYRSFQNDPDLSTPFDALEFGRGNISIEAAPMNEFKGRIYDVGWQLDLKGSIIYGNPFTVRFQGKRRGR